MLIRSTVWLLTIVVPPVFADRPQPVTVNAIPDRYRPLSFDQEKLAGILAERIRATIEGYLERAGDKGLLAEAQTGEADDSQLRAIEAGTFLSAAANAYEYSHDPNLKAVMDRLAKQLLNAQFSTGYLARYQDRGRWTSGDIHGYRCDLLGLLAYYRVTGADDALAASERLGDLLVKTAKAPSPAVTNLIEPLTSLYRYTGDSGYLDLAKSLAGTWLQAKPRITATYENLSELAGLIELYRTTGDEWYFRPAAAAWNDIESNHLTITGAPDAGHSRARAQLESAATDICATTAWIQLTLNLLRITGQAEYGNQLERTIYNQLFASEDPKTGNVFLNTPIDGVRSVASTIDACVAAEAEGLSLIPAAVWGRSANGIAIILYTPGRATFQLRRRGAVQLYSEATFPDGGDILLHVEPSHPIQFPLRLRVPEWTTQFVADVAGSHWVGKPGEYLTITREWRRGDTVKIAMNMTARIINGGREREGEIAIQRGPQILALGKAVNPAIADLAQAGPLSTDLSELRTSAAESRFPANWAGNPAYMLPGEYNGKRQQLVLVPFADATDCKVWMRKPGAVSGATGH